MAPILEMVEEHRELGAWFANITGASPSIVDPGNFADTYTIFIFACVLMGILMGFCVCISMKCCKHTPRLSCGPCPCENSFCCGDPKASPA